MTVLNSQSLMWVGCCGCCNPQLLTSAMPTAAMSNKNAGMTHTTSIINADKCALLMGYTIQHTPSPSRVNACRPLPVQTSTGEDMWFRGRACLAAILEELQILQHVDKATEFIVSGGSAGG